MNWTESDCEGVGTVYFTSVELRTSWIDFGTFYACVAFFFSLDFIHVPHLAFFTQIQHVCTHNICTCWKRAPPTNIVNSQNVESSLYYMENFSLLMFLRAFQACLLLMLSHSPSHPKLCLLVGLSHSAILV